MLLINRRWRNLICGHTDNFKLHAPAAGRISSGGAYLNTIATDLECVAILMSVDTIPQVSSIVSARYWVGCSDTFGVFRTSANKNMYRCRHTCDLKVHAPSMWGISALRADLGTISCDLECMIGMVGVHAVA